MLQHAPWTNYPADMPGPTTLNQAALQLVGYRGLIRVQVYSTQLGSNGKIFPPTNLLFAPSNIAITKKAKI